MKVLIVDDEPLARDELAYLAKQDSHVSVVEEAGSIEEAAKKLAAEEFTIIFLDIRLDDGNGINFGKQLAKKYPRLKIFFATAYDQYALPAFEASAVDYILEPFEESRVKEAIKRVWASSKPAERSVQLSQAANPRMSVTFEDQTRVINKRDILYVEVNNGDLVITTKSQKIQAKLTLTKMGQLLDPQDFLKVHRSFLVNLNEIKKVEPGFNHTYELTMSNQEKVPVSRSFVTDMKQALGM
ncbi:LytR/AlgR family response regulator transcription factor [Lactobacillus delbrueckii]|uniref:LytR/AlgR family response regulator transcription factor n=1 Tax=Lactobacillus delbrueckii TaxID=1584 RepID=UPI0025B19C7D|nr:LytTR family transcriptional regulator DNA-binding domain-containing protein [Lactobacillus delbrueckii]